MTGSPTMSMAMSRAQSRRRRSRIAGAVARGAATAHLPPRRCAIQLASRARSRQPIAPCGNHGAMARAGMSSAFGSRRLRWCQPPRRNRARDGSATTGGAAHARPGADSVKATWQPVHVTATFGRNAAPDVDGPVGSGRDAAHARTSCRRPRPPTARRCGSTHRRSRRWAISATSCWISIAPLRRKPHWPKRSPTRPINPGCCAAWR